MYMYMHMYMHMYILYIYIYLSAYVHVHVHVYTKSHVVVANNGHHGSHVLSGDLHLLVRRHEATGHSGCKQSIEQGPAWPLEDQNRSS